MHSVGTIAAASNYSYRQISVHKLKKARRTSSGYNARAERAPGP